MPQLDAILLRLAYDHPELTWRWLIGMAAVEAQTSDEAAYAAWRGLLEGDLLRVDGRGTATLTPRGETVLDAYYYPDAD